MFKGHLRKMDHSKLVMGSKNRRRLGRHHIGLDLDAYLRFCLLSVLMIGSSAEINTEQPKNSSMKVNPGRPSVDQRNITSHFPKTAQPAFKIDTIRQEKKIEDVEDPNMVNPYVSILKNDTAVYSFANMNTELDRHRYNVTIRTSKKYPTPSNPVENSTTTTDVMESSDSNFVPHSTGSDEEPDNSSTSLSNDLDLQDELDKASEMASSNRNQQKVMKEITKILSKGMSGATDQVRLETLESWKRKQKERKAIKETRAKVFEDILTAAISSHPERTKKKSKKRSREESIRTFNSPPSASTGEFDSVESPDPELVGDAETVIKHLQGLATMIESPPTNPSGFDQHHFSDQDNQGSTSSADDSTSNEVNSEDKVSLKKVVSNNYRPFARRIKRFKQQISNRRKQLDHIKKMFNVDLAINPKDGTLMDKSAPKKREKQDAIDDSSTDGESGPSFKTKSTKSAAKMQELMSHLKENPDILASVMAELTTDSDPSRHQSLSGNEDGSYQPSAMSLPLDQSDSSMPNWSSDNPRKFNPQSKSVYHGLNELEEGNLMDTKIPRQLHNRQSSTSAIDPSELPDDFSDSPSQKSLRRSKPKRKAGSRDRLMNEAPSQTYPKPATAEVRLLESLRDRQLMNLARLDQVLAERQHMSGSSQVFKTMNSSNSTRQDKAGERRSITNQNSSDRPTNGNRSQQPEISDLQRVQNQTSNSGQSDEEVLHHFMVMNEELGNRLSSNDSFASKIAYQPHQTTSSMPFFGGPISQPRYNNYPSSILNQVPTQYQQSPGPGVGVTQGGVMQPLDRFRDWRDAGQSEASGSSFHGQNNQVNFGQPWAYQSSDLTMGSSAAMGSLGSAPFTTAPPLQVLKPSQYPKQVLTLNNQQPNHLQPPRSHHERFYPERQHLQGSSRPSTLGNSELGSIHSNTAYSSVKRGVSINQYPSQEIQRSDTSIARAGTTSMVVDNVSDSHVPNRSQATNPQRLAGNRNIPPLPTPLPFMTRSELSVPKTTMNPNLQHKSLSVEQDQPVTNEIDNTPLRDSGGFEQNSRSNQQSAKTKDHHSAPVDYFKAYKGDWREIQPDEPTEDENSSSSAEDGKPEVEPSDPDSGAMWA